MISLSARPRSRLMLTLGVALLLVLVACARADDKKDQHHDKDKDNHHDKDKDKHHDKGPDVIVTSATVPGVHTKSVVDLPGSGGLGHGGFGRDQWSKFGSNWDKHRPGVHHTLLPLVPPHTPRFLDSEFYLILELNS